MPNPTQLYLSLLKECLTYRIWGTEGFRKVQEDGITTPVKDIDWAGVYWRKE